MSPGIEEYRLLSGIYSGTLGRHTGLGGEGIRRAEKEIEW